LPQNTEFTVYAEHKSENNYLSRGQLLAKYPNKLKTEENHPKQM